MPTVTLYPTSSTVITTGWTNPANAHADDAVYATAAPAKNGSIETAWSGFDFSGIPANATIDSVAAVVQFKVSTTGSVGEFYWRGVPHSGVLPAESSDLTEPTADKTVSTTYAWSRADLDTGTQVRARARRGNTNTAFTGSLDFVRLDITYTEAVGADIPLAGITSGSSGSASLLSAVRGLTGSSGATASSSSSLTVTAAPIALAGTSSGTSTATSRISAAIPLAGSSSATSTTASALTVEQGGVAVGLAGASTGNSASDALLSAAVPLLAGSASTSSSVAAMAVVRRLLGVSAGYGMSDGLLAVSSPSTLGGSSSGTAGSAGSLAVLLSLSGACGGTSGTWALLTVPGAEPEPEPGPVISPSVVTKRPVLTGLPNRPQIRGT